MNTSTRSTIAIGCDEAAFHLKETVRGHLEKLGHSVKNYGVHNTEPSLDPNIALEVSSAVAEGSTSKPYLCAARESAWP